VDCRINGSHPQLVQRHRRVVVRHPQDQVSLPTRVAHDEVRSNRSRQMDRGPPQPPAAPRVTRTDLPVALEFQYLTNTATLKKATTVSTHHRMKARSKGYACARPFESILGVSHIPHLLSKPSIVDAPAKMQGHEVSTQPTLESSQVPQLIS